ncbi:integrase domain-containing protein [uncultured Aquimonas sp.]|uniref:integrase domain-containing protein n=1 Tax=uncultured Aquimonas sp. TaxID=385483 RepID=UPI00260EB21E|nr:integrase domain-containing protein [uncultured Aquimonas sp.]
MSRKNRLKAELDRKLNKAGGAHLTKESGRRFSRCFTRLMRTLGFTHLLEPEQIMVKHIVAYVEARKEEGIATRTLQNEVAHLRKILRLSNRSQLADSSDISNAALGLSGASRKGTKQPMTGERLLELQILARQQDRPGMAALLGLEYHLGLRGAEAIHACTDTLMRWRQELSASSSIRVLAGTKGGRPRDVLILRPLAAAWAIFAALEVCQSQGGFLVVRKDGSPAGGLKQARSIYHAWAHRAGIEPHAARYAFAANQMEEYLRRGYSEREALIAISHALGHGDGRGRWVRSVYLQTPGTPRSTPADEVRA